MIKYILILLLVTYSSIFAQLERIWEKSATLNNLPSWFSTTESSETGIAYLRLTNSLYVVSNKGGESNIIILNAATGDSIGKLNTTGISGGDLKLFDIECDQYGTYIYASNFVDSITHLNPFKIYRWTSVNSAPELYYTDTINSGQTGRISITNYWTAHLSYSSKNSNKVNIIDLFSNQKHIFTLPFNIEGNNVSVTIAEYQSDFNHLYLLINSDNNYARHYIPSWMNELDTILTKNSNSVKFYSNPSLCCNYPFLVAYQYGEGKENLAYKHSWSDPIHESPNLGNNPNPFNRGDVDFNTNVQWGTRVIVYVLSANNGIGAYYTNIFTPVELTSFNALIINNKIKLNWETATETNNMGFEIQRTIKNEKLQITNWETIGFVDGKGTTTEPNKYLFVDETAEEGNIYKYKLKQIDFDGTTTYSDEIEIDFSVPKEFSLSQNYPNPFNPSTVISYQLAVDSKVLLKVYDVLGNEVLTLINENKPAGKYTFELDGSNLPSGVYFYQINAGDFISTKKMVLLK